MEDELLLDQLELETTQIGELVEESYPTLVDVQTPEIQKSDEVLDNPGDLLLKLVQGETVTLGWMSFVIDRGRRARAEGCVKKTRGGNLEEAWSRRPPKPVGKPCSRRTTKERGRFLLAGIAATMNGKNGGSRRAKARIRQISRRSRRSEAWARRIWKHGGGSRIPTEIMRGIRGYGGAVKSGRRREAWCRQIAKERGSPALDFEPRLGKFSTLAMDDSAERKKGRYFDIGTRPGGRLSRRRSSRCGRDLAATTTSRRERGTLAWRHLCSSLLGVPATTKGQSGRAHCRSGRPLGGENQRDNDGRLKPHICKIPKHSGRSEAWSRQIAKARGSPAPPDFEQSRSRLTSVVMDDSGNQKGVENWADKILRIYGPTSHGTWSFYWAAGHFVDFRLGSSIIGFGPNHLGMENGSLKKSSEDFERGAIGCNTYIFNV